MPPVKVIPPLKPGKSICKKRSNKKQAPPSAPAKISQQPPPDTKKSGNKEQTIDNHEHPESDDEDPELSDEENNPEGISTTETELKTLKSDEVKDTLGRANINDKALKS